MYSKWEIIEECDTACIHIILYWVHVYTNDVAEKVLHIKHQKGTGVIQFKSE